MGFEPFENRARTEANLRARFERARSMMGRERVRPDAKGERKLHKTKTKGKECRVQYQSVKGDA